MSDVICSFFQITFRQTNTINMNFFYTSFMLEILQQFKEFSQIIHKITLILSSKVKKTWKISESGGLFEVLTHDNYEQTNGIQSEFFYAGPMLRILQQTKELSIMHFKGRNFELKSWKKNPLKNIELFWNFKRKINLNK